VKYHVDVESSEKYEQVVEVVLENMAVSADWVGIVQHAAGVGMILDGEADCVRPVCHAVDAILNISQAAAEVVLKMEPFEAGGSGGDGD
jgi:hypothetical protein